MHTLWRAVSLRVWLTEQLPELAAAFLIAETSYKFGSFSLECVAFLATWWLLDLLVRFVKSRFAAAGREVTDT